MAKVTRIAKGFSGLFGLQGTGETPREVSEFVQPTIDTLELYATERGYRISSLASGVGALLATVTIPVPEGDMWLVQNVECRMQFGAVGQEYVIALRRDGVPGRQGGGFSSTTLSRGRIGPALDAAGFDVIAYNPPQPMLMLGGEEITGTIYDASGFLLNTMRVQVIYSNIGTGAGVVGKFR